MQIIFDNLSSTTISALVADEGLPSELKRKLEKLISRRQRGGADGGLSLSHGSDAFVRHCESTAREMAAR